MLFTALEPLVCQAAGIQIFLIYLGINILIYVHNKVAGTNLSLEIKSHNPSLPFPAGAA